MAISDYDTEELAAKILGFGNEYEPDEVEQKMYDAYEISMENFHKLICVLAPMCAVGQTAFGGKMSRGFADIESQCFIARIDA